jgi:hypothetical protein
MTSRAKLNWLGIIIGIAVAAIIGTLLYFLNQSNRVL